MSPYKGNLRNYCPPCHIQHDGKSFILIYNFFAASRFLCRYFSWDVDTRFKDHSVLVFPWPLMKTFSLKKQKWCYKNYWCLTAIFFFSAGNFYNSNPNLKLVATRSFPLGLKHGVHFWLLLIDCCVYLELCWWQIGLS